MKDEHALHTLQEIFWGVPIKFLKYIKVAEEVSGFTLIPQMNLQAIFWAFVCQLEAEVKWQKWNVYGL